MFAMGSSDVLARDKEAKLHCNQVVSVANAWVSSGSGVSVRLLHPQTPPNHPAA